MTTKALTSYFSIYRNIVRAIQFDMFLQGKKLFSACSGSELTIINKVGPTTKFWHVDCLLQNVTLFKAISGFELLLRVTCVHYKQWGSKNNTDHHSY